MLRPLAMLTAAASLAFAPVAAQAAPARTGAPTSAQSEGLNGDVPVEGLVLGAAVFLLIIFLLVDDEGQPDFPTSP
jgi:hypothetical protein